MGCILLTDMEPPTTSSPTAANDLLPAHQPACDLRPKEEPGATCLSVHLYRQVKDGAGCGSQESVLTFPAGQYVAEELCVSAAKACGEFQGEPSLTSSSDWLLQDGSPSLVVKLVEAGSRVTVAEVLDPDPADKGRQAWAGGPRVYSAGQNLA